MAQTPRAKMHLRSVFLLMLLVLSVVAESCFKDTEYEKDGKCCKTCGPGTKLMLYSTCETPVCNDCADGEYQAGYTSEAKCLRQPNCDPNLNLKSPEQSKTKYIPCVCVSGHHCAESQCDSCVRNSECQQGERISKNATQGTDTVCEPCPAETFSDHKSAFTCKPWTICSSGQEISPGSSTSDRICEAQIQKAVIVVPIVVILLLLVVAGLIFWLYKAKTGSGSFIHKLQACKCWGTKYTPQPAPDNVCIETEPQQPVNQPQEDTEDLVKLDVPLSPGVSENGLPVSQDHSKSLILSQTETEPGSFSNYF